MRLKDGVKLAGLSSQMALATQIISGVFAAHDFDTVVTSGNDSKHGDNSLHYSGRALDFRTHHVDPAQKMAIVQDIKARLGAEFDVVFESPGGDNEHVHVEYDPK